MRKTETRGVGLFQRRVEVINAEDDPEAFEAALRDTLAKGPEQVWSENEETCLEWLRRSGVDTESDRAIFFAARDFPEDSAQFLAIEWLRAWRRARAAREKGDIVAAMVAADEMGVNKERTRWRCGVDPETRERREALGLQARKSRLARPRATDARRERAAKRRDGGDLAPDEKLAWRQEAIEHARDERLRHPTHAASRVAKEMAPAKRYGDGSSRAWRQTLEVIKFLWS